MAWRPTVAYFTGNEVLSCAEESLGSHWVRLCLRLLFHSDGAGGGAVWLGRAGVGPQRTSGVVTGAAEAAFERGGGECPFLVLRAKGAWAEVAGGRRRGTADGTVMPRTFPAPCDQTHSVTEEKTRDLK